MIKREYRCYYDGQQEELYFKHFSNLIKAHNKLNSIKFGRSADLKYLESMPTEVPKIAVFDHDSNDTEFRKKVQICKKTRILYSSLNFDLWLLLHKKSFNHSVSNNGDYVNEIRKAYKLGKTDDIKKKCNIEKILSQITIEDIKFAIENAKKIMESKDENDKRVIRKNFCYYDNPSMSIHTFFEEILKIYGID